MTPEFRYEKLRWKEIDEAAQKNRVILIPIACVEDHGPHLPLDVDIAISRLDREKGIVMARRRRAPRAR